MRIELTYEGGKPNYERAIREREMLGVHVTRGATRLEVNFRCRHERVIPPETAEWAAPLPRESKGERACGLTLTHREAKALHEALTFILSAGDSDETYVPVYPDQPPLD